MVQQSPTFPLLFQGRDILPFHLPVQFLPPPPPSAPCSALFIPCPFFWSLPTPFPGTIASLCMSHILVLGPQPPRLPSPTRARLKSIYYALFTSNERKTSSHEVFGRLLSLAWMTFTMPSQHGLYQLCKSKRGSREVSACSRVVSRLYHQINTFVLPKNT